MGGKTQNALVTISVFGLLIMLMVKRGSHHAQTGPDRWCTDQRWHRTGLYRSSCTVRRYSVGHCDKNQMPDEDPRDAVARIRELNQLQSAEIFPGQVLTLEVKRPVQAGQLASRP